MHIGQLVAKLRIANGDSLRDAAARTGVSHTTIARIEKGEVTGSFHHTLRRIAEGYGVKVEYLLRGRDPRQDFEQSIRRLSVDERNRLYFTSIPARVRMVLDFLSTEYPNEFSLEQLVRTAGCWETDLNLLTADHSEGPEVAEAANRVADALSKVTGIPSYWFRVGTLADENRPGIAGGDAIGAYIPVFRKAAEAGVEPEILNMAIELLITKQKLGTKK